MKRILIMGNSGSGKSTLAKKLAEKYKIPTLDLDTVTWKKDIVERLPLEESLRLIDIFTANNPEWIIEGCYGSIFQEIANKSNELLFLNPGVESCVSHNKNRPHEAHKFSTLEEQNRHFDFLQQWVSTYPLRDDEFGKKEHSRIFEEYSGVKKEYKTDKEYIE